MLGYLNAVGLLREAKTC
ncbi:unnamed protein product [Lathyrus oleraceus]